jgi:hypothetical protein
VEPHRSYSGDGDQRWYEGREWERGRHGAQAPSGGESADPAFGGTGEARPNDGYEPGFLTPGSPRFGDTDPPGRVPPFGAEPVSGPIPDPGEPSRRPVESIDVGPLRRNPVSAPPDQPSAYATDYVPVPGFAPPAAYAAPEQPLYPATQSTGGYGPGSNPLSAPTAAVNTIQPSRSSLYASRKPAVAIVLAVATLLFEIPALRLLVSAAIEDIVSVSGIVAGTFLVAGLPVFAYGLYGLLGGAAVNTNAATWLKAPLVYVPLGLLLFLFAALAAA